ncbi:hypothetical protein PILCRDRAFT_377823 [Piloderma croceum F 1598]|uniref:Uncharacterized protein n=1 Tax=Piloderma croceum (strain F 1598) TaxID=765440 RepID=A0A0C3C5Q3_PILCF|nr:hypothetical protein PILCRDRAFT_377823 [Piloderma croceum F 1598]
MSMPVSSTTTSPSFLSGIENPSLTTLVPRSELPTSCLHKPHLPKSTSLPSLKLTPTPAPAPFSTCESTNNIPCLWCAWTMGDFEFEFEQKRGVSVRRRRRASSPARVGFQIGLGFGGCHAPGVRHSPTEDAESGINRRHSTSTSSLLGDRKEKENTKRYGMITGISTHSESRPSSMSHRRSYASVQLVRARSQFFAPETTQEPAYAPNSTPPETRNTNTPTPPPSSPSLGPFPNTTVLSPTLAHSSSSLSLSLTQPERTLRRKQRMTLLKQRSSRSLRVPLLNTRLDVGVGDDENDTTWISPTMSIPMPVPVSMQQQEYTTVVRVGHPSRPYYSAIRPSNMSRPNSPFGSSSPTSPSSFFSPPPPLPCASDLASRTSYQGHVVDGGDSTIGFSLSGEMELRMGLARFRSAEGEGPPLHPHPSSEYRFREMGTAAEGSSKAVRSKGGCVKGSGRIGGKMKRLGMGIMEVVLGRR